MLNDVDLAVAVAEAGATVVHRCFGSTLDLHFAAGLAVCETAGCIVTDLRGDSWGNGPTGLLAAADLATHSALLTLVRKYLV